MGEILIRLVAFYNYVFDELAVLDNPFIKDGYRHIITLRPKGAICHADEVADSRSKTYLLGAKPYRSLIILAIYLIFVLKLGPKWMKNRRPYNLKTVLMAYNFIQVVLCGYIFIAGIRMAWGWKYKWFCEPVDVSNSENAINILNLVYLYYITKIVDLLDTVFFVLRKKYNQISFLHLYHHTGMVMLIWGAFTYLPGGHGTFVGQINSFVHVIMYTYYFVSVYKPEVRNWLWLKRFVTQVQIVQFFLLVIHIGAIAFIKDCGYPRWTALIFVPQNLFLLILFVDFYIKAYVRKPKSDLSKENNASKSNGNNKLYEGNYTQFVKNNSEAANSDLRLRTVMRS